MHLNKAGWLTIKWLTSIVAIASQAYAFSLWIALGFGVSTHAQLIEGSVLLFMFGLLTFLLLALSFRVNTIIPLSIALIPLIGLYISVLLDLNGLSTREFYLWIPVSYIIGVAIAWLAAAALTRAYRRRSENWGD